MIWLGMWRCAGLGFALEEFDNDHVAAAARADHPRLFRWGICLGLVIDFWVWPLRHAKKLADCGNLFDAHTAG